LSCDGTVAVATQFGCGSCAQAAKPQNVSGTIITAAIFIWIMKGLFSFAVMTWRQGWMRKTSQ
jgi:hypothetical protein